MTGIGRLTGTVKHYDWGGKDFIPSILEVNNSEGRPFAEFWLGIHPLADCKVIAADGQSQLLRDLIAANTQESLGVSVASNFGTLPYLLKILDVKNMLSIQVHPTKNAAKDRFEWENQQGIAVDAPNRNYKDDNHKPELICALSEFWLLHGFKNETALNQVFNTVEELKPLESVFRSGGYKGLYTYVMMLPQEQVNAMLQPLIDRITPLYKNNKLEKSNEDFWAARASITFPRKDGGIDRGIFSVYFFNLLQLKKGQGLFQDAGVLHAYLEGQNVEIMANSDNVLRGGLTSKHIDVEELLKHVKCEPAQVRIIEGRLTASGERVYETTAPDFELGSFSIEAGEKVEFESVTTEILLIIEGEATVHSGQSSFELVKGEPAVVAFAGQPITLHAKEKSLVFRASVPA